MEMCRTAVGTRAPGISLLLLFFFLNTSKFLVSDGRVSIQLPQG